MASFLLTGKPLDFNTLSQVFQAKQTLDLPDDVLGKMKAAPAGLPAGALETSRAYLEAHVVNFGPETEERIIRLALLLLIHSQLLKADAGSLQKSTLQRLQAFYNREVYPLVLRSGSDDTRLAQLCQPLVLSGKVRFQGYPLKAAEVAEMFSWPAVPLTPAEVQALLAAPVFIWAQTADVLMHLKPLVNWFIYFEAVFSRVLPQDHTDLHLSLKELIKYLAEGQQALEQEINRKEKSLSLHTDLANLVLTLQEVMANQIKLNQVLLSGLEALVEPPHTATFELVIKMGQLIEGRAPKPVIPTEENFSTLLILENLEELISLSQTLASWVFWSFIQADAISGEFLESSTLQAYQQAGLFVPEETANEQLEKITDFIQTHFPVGAA